MRFLRLLRSYLVRLREGEKGQALVEYALILFLVSIVSIEVLSVLGGHISSMLSTVTADI